MQGSADVRRHDRPKIGLERRRRCAEAGEDQPGDGLDLEPHHPMLALVEIRRHAP